MTTDRRDIALRQTLAASLLLFGVALLVSHCVQGCFPADKEAEAAGGYAAQQLACVDTYADRHNIDACRAKVRAAWAVTDAGGGQ